MVGTSEGSSDHNANIDNATLSHQRNYPPSGEYPHITCPHRIEHIAYTTFNLRNLLIILLPILHFSPCQSPHTHTHTLIPHFPTLTCTIIHL